MYSTYEDELVRALSTHGVDEVHDVPSPGTPGGTRKCHCHLEVRRTIREIEGAGFDIEKRV